MSLAILLFSNCKRDNPKDIHTSPPLNVPEKQFVNFSKPTLEEFIDSVDEDLEILFFENTGITDNTLIVEEAIVSGGPLEPKPKVSFKWHGKGGTGGCSKPLGVCAIITFGLEEANVDLMISQNKYIFIYEENQDDNGLTSDGYLPIMEDIYVNEDITILSGIYKANLSADGSEYFAVGIDIL